MEYGGQFSRRRRGDGIWNYSDRLQYGLGGWTGGRGIYRADLARNRARRPHRIADAERIYHGRSDQRQTDDQLWNRKRWNALLIHTGTFLTRLRLYQKIAESDSRARFTWSPFVSA